MGTGERIRSKTLAAYLDRLGPPEGPQRNQWLSPRLSHLTPPDGMLDRQKAAERLSDALRAKQTIVVFGDYDCDGMTATAIMVDGLTRLGGRAVPILSSRFSGGYGVSPEAVQRILDEGPGLVVTCDCGSSDHPSLRLLEAAGVDVLVIDHHLVPDEPLPALAFLNPRRPECGFPYKNLASCGLALSILAALRKELGAELDLKSLLEFVAIGTIADVVPLDGDNRALVRAGLARLRESDRPGIVALLEVAGLEGDYPLSAMDVAFRIAPRLNAPGRMGPPDLALRLLLEKNPTRARELAVEVEALCQRRRDVQAEIQKEAEADIKQLGLLPGSSLVLGRADWNHGIVGIVAGRLADEHRLPTVVIGFEGDIGRGSVRGPQGFPLYDALSECAEHLIRFGGHQAAAGLTIAPEKLSDFRTAFEQACAKRSEYEAPSRPVPLEVAEGDDLADVVRDLELLEPCGAGNPLPEFALSARLISARELRGGHLKLALELAPGRRLSAFAPGKGALQDSLSGQLRLVGSLRPDHYRGGGAVELLVSSVSAIGQEARKA